ncbi:MAG: YopX family protein [Bacteroidales bacterium]|nr:YopX family protein [Clostridium sp.]MCM1204732.1 YopX family protein [Bacteroidales bacterium]
MKKDTGRREIFFRAKRSDTGEWVYGAVLSIGEEDYIVCGAETSCIDGENTDLYATEWYEADPGTICQYTGLKDKNGKEIYEGDILSGQMYHDYGEYGEYVPEKCVVKWDGKRAAFAPVYWWSRYNHDIRNYEIIGNIYDTPELLKAEG